MGHPQPDTPIQVDNSTCDGIMNRKINQKRYKATEMRFHWVRYRVKQKQFDVICKPGLSNFG